jgi:hypothetical protein
MIRLTGFQLFLALILIVVVSHTATDSFAQDARANRRAFVEDLLRGLIDSQRPQNPNPRGSNKGNRVPAGSSIPRPAIEVSPEMRSVRDNLTAMAGQYDILIRELQTLELKSHQFRPLMADALQVRAEVDNLSRKAQIYPRVETLVPDYQRIDRDYRVLTHRLRQSHQLNKSTTRCLDRIAQIDTKLCGLFGIEPQIDRRELLRLTTALRSDFQHMLQDIYYESNRRPELQPVLNDGKRLYANINQATGLISSAAYPTIVASFTGCHQQWRNFNRQLYPYADKRLLRDLQQIEAHGAQIRDQLYLATELDREYLAFLASSINNGAADMLNLVTMNDLLQCKAPNEMLINAREFCEMGDALKNNIAAGQPIEELAWDYRLFDVQWLNMREQLAILKKPAINQHLADIDYTVSTLRQNLGEGSGMSLDQMTQMTAGLDQLTYQLDREIDRMMASGGYNSGFARSIRKDAHQLHVSVHDLQTDIAAGQSIRDVSGQVRQVCRLWDKTKNRMAKLNDTDRWNVSRFDGQIEPIMVKLKLVFEINS